jgi:hypothetical protein
MITRKQALLAVFVLLLGAVIWSVLFKSKDEPITLKDFVGLIPSVIPLLGASNEDKKHGKRRPRDRHAPPADAKNVPSPTVARRFHLTPSFDSGLYGGLVGGAIAGLLIGALYYIDSRTSSRGVKVWWDIIPHVFVYATLAGALLGASTQLTILWFRYLVTERRYSTSVFNEVSGGVLGGLAVGIPVGAWGGWFFGQRPIPFPHVSLVVTGAGLGTIFIILGTLLYDYEGSWRKIVRALFVSAVITTLAATLGIVILQSLQIDMRYFSGSEAIVVTEGGAILGVIIGIVLGLQVGLTLRLYRLWEITSEPNGG